MDNLAKEIDCYNRYNKGIHYAGHISKIPSGLPCLKWSKVNVHPNHNYTEDHNYCRNPLPSEVDSPYCYTTKEFGFEKCIIPVCGKVLQNSTKDSHYDGQINITRKGYICKNGAYCRAPSNDPDSDGGPWCYTRLGNGHWDYCNVPVCESKF
ncbi:PLG [Mytilus edulis]|uniref:PLG n=1 Tax=Mytilus edulis TaxID=6550 RepID=A0A8S3V0S9_MYTED|nr:PLG [Mytilus edulis]